MGTYQKKSDELEKICLEVVSEDSYSDQLLIKIIAGSFSLTLAFASHTFPLRLSPS